MRTRFHQALDGLKERLLVMAGLVEAGNSARNLGLL